MVSGRHTSATPRSSRRVSARAHRPLLRLNNPGYNHISIQQRAIAEESSAEPDKKDDFVRHESVQVKIEEQLRYMNRLATSPKSPTRPRTFAEATMSTRTRGRAGRKSSLKDGEATVNGPMTLESLGPFRYTFKKKKRANKWAPLDLSGTDSVSEVGSISEVDTESSRAVSPSPQTFLGSPSLLLSPRTFNTTHIIPTLSPSKENEKVLLIDKEKEFTSFGDIHQTPTQNIFEFTPLAPSAPDSSADTGSFLDSISYNYSLDEVESTPSDTQSTKDRTEAAMTSIAEAFGTDKLPKIGEDAFDSVEWDPDLPSASAPESPEIVPVAPKPIAYTTVGSIVKNAPPSFTAPHRIQREGAGRRPLIPFNQNRPTMSIRHQESSYFHPREPLPPLNMQNSMHYTQQLTQSPLRVQQRSQSTSSHSSRSTMSLHQASLPEDEQKIFKTITAPQMFSGNIGGSPNNRHPSSKPLTATTSEKNFSALTRGSKAFNSQDVGLQAPSDLVGEDGNRRSNNLSGLEKMQTIQRLAKFDNPMQELARSRLSALSVTNYLGRSVAHPNGVSTSASSPLAESMSSKVPPGELDRSYQFPPPGFGGSLVSHSNTLRSYSDSATQSSIIRTGVPQPLTAGPPGQRPYLTGVSKAPTNAIESRQFSGDSSLLNTKQADYFFTTTSQGYFDNSSLIQQSSTDRLLQVHGLDLSQPTNQTQQEHTTTFEGEIISSNLVDTLPVSVITQYYPHGLPSSMDGSYKPLSYNIMVRMGQISGVRKPVTAEEKMAAKEKAMSDWFYGEQRKLTKTIDDHINDLEERECGRKRYPNPFGAIGPPSKENIPEKKIISAEEFRRMTTAEASIPLINAAFGALLKYADRTSESRARLSGWEKSPVWLIDDSDKGNMSFFGEDWGPPPNRVSRVRSFHPVFCSTNTCPGSWVKGEW